MHGRVQVVVAAALWGTTGTAQALGPDELPARVVGAARLAIGAVALVVLLVVRERRLPALRLARAPVLLAGLAMAGYQLLLFDGVRRAGVSLGQVVGIGTTPVWAGIVSTALGRRPGARWLVGTAAAIGGAALLIGGEGEPDALGLVECVGAGLAYVAYAAWLERATAAEPPAGQDRTVAATFVVAAVVLLPAFAGAPVAPLATGDGSLMALHLGVVTVAVAYLFFGRGLAVVGVAVAATLTLAEPLTAAVLGSVVLDEPFGLVGIAGTALLLVGMALAGRARRPAAHLTQ